MLSAHFVTLTTTLTSLAHTRYIPATQYLNAENTKGWNPSGCFVSALWPWYLFTFRLHIVVIIVLISLSCILISSCRDLLLSSPWRILGNSKWKKCVNKKTRCVCIDVWEVTPWCSNKQIYFSKCKVNFCGSLCRSKVWLLKEQQNLSPRQSEKEKDPAKVEIKHHPHRRRP